MGDSAGRQTAPRLHKRLIDACQAAVHDSRPVVPLPEEPLYHFTDIEALQAIVTTKTLRISLATALNDASEVSHGLEIAQAYLRANATKDPRPYGVALGNLLRDAFLMPEPLLTEIFPFAACFCETAESSSQWLNYGKSGRGAALAFHAEVLTRIKGLELRKIDYDRNSQAARIVKVIEAGRRTLVEHTGGDPKEGDLMLAAYIVSMSLRLLASELKHPSFESEKEWRLMGPQTFVDGKILAGPNATPGPTHYRITNERLIPYEVISFGPEAVHSVVLGYSSPVDVDAVRLLLLDKQCRAKVSRSRVAVR